MKKIKINKVIGSSQLTDKEAEFLKKLQKGKSAEAAALKIADYLRKASAPKKGNKKADLIAALKNLK
jgi:hypothetical protein